MSCEEYRKKIAEALEHVKDEKILRHIYIGVLVAESKESEGNVDEQG